MSEEDKVPAAVFITPMLCKDCNTAITEAEKLHDGRCVACREKAKE